VAAEGGRIFKREDLTYIGTAGKQGTEPKTTCVAFEPSGLYVLRSGWDNDAVWMALKCGPDGGWHCQPDNGSFELYAYGRYFMPDTGCYIYHGDDKARNWFKATRQHQTLTLDNANSAYKPKLLLWQDKGDTPVLVVENASYKGLKHRRTVFFVERRAFVIVDEALGSATGSIDVHFQFGPGKVTATDDSIHTNYKDANLVFKALTPAAMQVEKGEVAFHYGKREKRPAYRFHLGDKAPAVFASAIVPYKGSTCPEITGRINASFNPGDPLLKLEVTCDGKSHDLKRKLPR
jgi:heparan-sulfate lyase